MQKTEGETCNFSLFVFFFHFLLFAFHFFSYLCTAFQDSFPLKEGREVFRRDGRVVDYTGLENRRAERHRGFESLSLRNIT